MKRLLRAHCQGTKLIICYYILFLSLYMQLQNIFVIGYYPLVKNLLYLPFLCQKKITSSVQENCFLQSLLIETDSKLCWWLREQKNEAPKISVASFHTIDCYFHFPSSTRENLKKIFFEDSFLRLFSGDVIF